MMYKKSSKLNDCLEKAHEFAKKLKKENKEALILSRLKQTTIRGTHKEEMENFSTLHSIAANVLPYREIENLGGELMFKDVKKAVIELFPEYNNLKPEDLNQIVHKYYLAIRERTTKNGISESRLSRLKLGEEVLSAYNKNKSTLNWEDSLEVASFHLHKDKPLRNDLNYSEFIVVGIELLQEPQNKNALDFLNALALWGIRNNKKWNFWVIKSDDPNTLQEMHIYFDELENNY